MKKITVKRFLQKKLKFVELENTEESAYPLYYSITYNRKTQNIKSPCGAVMSEKALRYIESTNNILSDETLYLSYGAKDSLIYGAKESLMYTYENVSYSYIDLRKEYDFLKKAVELIILEGKKENIFERDFTPRIKRYFDSLEESLYGIGWYFHAPFKIYETEEDKRKDEKYRSVYNFKDDEKGAFQKAFYECFNKRKNLLDILDTIKKATKIDFENYFHEDILNTWKVIKAIETAHKDTCVIDFIINFDEKKYIELCEKFSYNIEKEEVTKIANELKERLNR